MDLKRQLAREQEGKAFHHVDIVNEENRVNNVTLGCAKNYFDFNEHATVQL